MTLTRTGASPSARIEVRAGRAPVTVNTTPVRCAAAWSLHEPRDREYRRPRERCRSHPSRSLRQLFAGLLSHHVGGVPVWPVRVALSRALLVLAVGGLDRKS